jgi:hypothetical protein
MRGSHYVKRLATLPPIAFVGLCVLVAAAGGALFFFLGAFVLATGGVLFGMQMEGVGLTTFAYSFIVCGLVLPVLLLVKIRKSQNTADHQFTAPISRQIRLRTKPLMAIVAGAALILLVIFALVKQNAVLATEVEQCNDASVKATILENGWKKPFLTQAEFIRRFISNRPDPSLFGTIPPESVQYMRKVADAVTIVNVRQQSYDGENNIRYCAAQIEIMPGISLEEKQKMALPLNFMMQFEMLARYGQVPKDEVPLPTVCVDPKRTLVYKIERVQDRNTFIVTWDCPGQIHPY